MGDSSCSDSDSESAHYARRRKWGRFPPKERSDESWEVSRRQLQLLERSRPVHVIKASHYAASSSAATGNQEYPKPSSESEDHRHRGREASTSSASNNGRGARDRNGRHHHLNHQEVLPPSRAAPPCEGRKRERSPRTEECQDRCQNHRQGNSPTSERWKPESSPQERDHSHQKPQPQAQPSSYPKQVRNGGYLPQHSWWFYDAGLSYSYAYNGAHGGYDRGKDDQSSKRHRQRS